MSTFTINFQANTLGIHYVGYRTYNDSPNTYTVINVNVIALGTQSVTIDVPGNLYCAYDGIEYTGYIIAACQDQTDGNQDGIPDIAVQWTLTMPVQDDPCQKTVITCIAVPIFSIDFASSPTSCTPGTYSVVFSEVTPGDEVSPAEAEVTVDGGGALSVVLIDVGLYKAVPTAAVTITNCSVPVDFTIVLYPNCDDLLLSDYACANHNDVSEDSGYEIVLGESVEICADPAALADLSIAFSAYDDGNCHCDACKKVIIDVPGAASGVGKITYQTCWDGSNPYGSVMMVSQVINWDDVLTLGCILPDTLVIDEGTLDASPVPVQHTCA